VEGEIKLKKKNFEEKATLKVVYSAIQKKKEKKRKKEENIK
jgi:hypothetical protein